MRMRQMDGKFSLKRDMNKTAFYIRVLKSSNEERRE